MLTKIFTRKPAQVAVVEVFEGPATYRAAQDEAHEACSEFSHSATDHFLSTSEGCWLLDA